MLILGLTLLSRSDGDGEMGEFRANRKFSAQVRDMVAAGRVEEAKAACEEQVRQLPSCAACTD